MVDRLAVLGAIGLVVVGTSAMALIVSPMLPPRSQAQAPPVTEAPPVAVPLPKTDKLPSPPKDPSQAPSEPAARAVRTIPIIKPELPPWARKPPPAAAASPPEAEQEFHIGGSTGGTVNHVSRETSRRYCRHHRCRKEH
jgi:hypothetical protein